MTMQKKKEEEVAPKPKEPSELEEMEHLYMLMQRHKVTQIGQVEVRLANLKS